MARHILGSHIVVADEEAVAVYRCHYVKIFSCPRMGTAKVPEFTLAREYCQESDLVHKLRGVTL